MVCLIKYEISDIDLFFNEILDKKLSINNSINLFKKI